MNILEILTENITSAPEVIQFAKDRKYEEAWIISIKDKKPTTAQIENYLLKEPFELLIVEYIWNAQEDDKRFVLTFFLNNKCALKNHKQFMEICLSQFYD